MVVKVDEFVPSVMDITIPDRGDVGLLSDLAMVPDRVGVTSSVGDEGGELIFRL